MSEISFVMCFHAETLPAKPLLYKMFASSEWHLFFSSCCKVMTIQDKWIIEEEDGCCLLPYFCTLDFENVVLIPKRRHRMCHKCNAKVQKYEGVHMNHPF